MSSGYNALRESAAWIDLSGRGKIRATGEDRARLLHALSTNHIQQLTPGTGCYAFFLNAQGRIQADANILCFADHFLIDTEPETHGKLFELIDRYIIADDVAIQDLTGSLVTIGVEGPQSGEILKALGATLPEADCGTVFWGERILAKLSAAGGPGYWIFCSAGEMPSVVKQLESAGVAAASEADVQTVRLEHGKPRYGEDILETTIPQESGQMHAVHTNKGCYLGQEIVERVRSRGHVNRRLLHFRMEGTLAPAPGAKILSGEKEAGEITSAAYSPALDRVFALGYVRAEFIRPGAAFRVGDSPASLLSGSTALPEGS